MYDVNVYWKIKKKKPTRLIWEDDLIDSWDKKIAQIKSPNDFFKICKSIQFSFKKVYYISEIGIVSYAAYATF